MPLVYPDLEWYSAVSERKRIVGRCPFAGVQSCPRYFDSVALLADAGTITPMPKDTYATASAKWRLHELAPANAEGSTSISGAADNPNCFANFCPEVTFDTFKLFATLLIRLLDDPVDREIAERKIKQAPSTDGKDWRWIWSHVEPLHYSDCPIYSKLNREKPMAQITFNAPVSGNVNIAGHSVHSSAMSLSIGELIDKLDASAATPAEKEAAKSKLSEFLRHPVVAAIIGGAAGTIIR